MGQITALPDGRMAGRPHPRSDYASFGLGYDARSRTHKVVRLMYHEYQAAGCDIYAVGATSSTGHGDRRWWPRAGRLPPEHVRMNEMGVFVQGHVHWVTMEYGRAGHEHIISLSMAEETFGYVMPPPGMAIGQFALLELAGCSAPHCPGSPVKSIDIWLLTDYGTGSWRKHWHIDLTKVPPPPPEFGDVDFMSRGVTPLALADGDRRILFVSREYQVASYCLATGTLEELVLVPGYRGRATLGAHFHLLVPYEESLVSAGRPFEDILFSSSASLALSMAMCRLPARTLGRLKPVCRNWHAMVESDRFATLHNAHARMTAASRPVSIVFAAPFGAPAIPGVPVTLFQLGLSAPPFVSLDSCSGEPAGGAERQNPPLSTSRVVCRKPCHGLILLTQQNGTCHALCNLVTQDARIFVFSDNEEQGRRCGCAGLGYDPSTEEHVVVHLCYTSRCLQTRSYTMECRVWPARDLHPRTLASQPPIPVAVDVPPVHVGGKMYWPREPRLGAAAAAAESSILAFDACTETFEVVSAPPVLLNVDEENGCRMVLAELAGKLCAVNLSASMETMTVWGKNDVEGWRREHVIELQQWPEFSPRLTELEVMPMAIDPIDGRILLDTGRALGYYDTRSQTLQTLYLLNSHDQDGGVFFIATTWEDSLLRPYNRKSRIW